MTLTLTPLVEFALIRRDDPVGGIVGRALRATRIEPLDGDILVVAQKIVSKAEGRAVDLRTVTPGERARLLASEVDKDPRVVELVLQESRSVLRYRPGTIIVEHRLGFVCANAGIDHSNVPGDEPGEWVLLLPLDPDRSARELRAALESAFAVKLGVLIIDSHGRAWRNGTVGMAIGISGLPGLVARDGSSRGRHARRARPRIPVRTPRWRAERSAPPAGRRPV
jgi:coenzyme F420-0:L-glutamate ligase/coenzyme F420-1:gamma-L-glutamate ligase